MNMNPAHPDRHPGRTRFVRGIGLAAALLAGACAGCASVRVDPDGTRHVFGFVSMRIPPPSSAASGRGNEYFSLSSFGLSVVRTELETGFTIGYQRYGSMTLGANACAVIARHD